MSSQTNTTHKIRGSAGRRAELLADRIEEGAAFLAAFAEGLSEEEWRATVSATDRRSVGIILHHVASMYPIEIDVARAITSGKAVTDVTWDVVAELNAKHAREHAEATKAAALELLRRNSHEAANAVRAFTDEELDLSPRSSSLRTTHYGTVGTTWRASAQPWAGDFAAGRCLIANWVCSRPRRKLARQPIGPNGSQKSCAATPTA